MFSEKNETFVNVTILIEIDEFHLKIKVEYVVVFLTGGYDPNTVFVGQIVKP